jgi:hypothetical protein
MKNIEKHIDEIVSKVLAEAISFRADNILNKAKNGITESLHGGQKKIDVAEPKGKITAADFEKLRSKKQKPRTQAGFEHGEIVSGDVDENWDDESDGQGWSEANKLSKNEPLYRGTKFVKEDMNEYSFGDTATDDDLSYGDMLPNADYEKQIANNYDKAEASALERAEAENKSLEYEKAKADLQIRTLGMSDKQIAIEQERLKYIKEQSDIRDRTDLRPDAKAQQQQILEDQYNQRVSIIETQYQYKVLEEMSTSVYKNMGDALENFVRTGKINFKSFAQSVIQDLILIQLKSQATQIMSGFMGNIVNAFRFGSAGAEHNALAASWNPPAADGGDLDANKIGLVGERGPELFVPKTAGTIIPNNMLAGMGGGQTINYNGTYIASMNAIDTQSGIQFLAKNKQAVWGAYQSANRSVPVTR